MTSDNLLLNSLALEPIERNLYRGRSETGWGGPRIFGGQVITQALLAAYETVTDRHCHSLHAYFERPGDPKIPILFEVERSRDGSSFTTRRVAAVQNGEQIFNLAASFHIAEKGLHHQSTMPDAPDPESLPDDFMAPPVGVDEETRRQFELAKRLRTIEIRQVQPQDYQNPRKMAPSKSVWVRSRDPVGSDLRLQHAALGFASDMNLFETAMRPYGFFWNTPGLQSASLDHALWFHQPFDFAEWHLFVQESTIAHSARGFVRGSVFARDGRLIASVAQEGLLRYRAPKS